MSSERDISLLNSVGDNEAEISCDNSFSQHKIVEKFRGRGLVAVGLVLTSLIAFACSSEEITESVPSARVTVTTSVGGESTFGSEPESTEVVITFPTATPEFASRYPNGPFLDYPFRTDVIADSFYALSENIFLASIYLTPEEDAFFIARNVVLAYEAKTAGSSPAEVFELLSAAGQRLTDRLCNPVEKRDMNLQFIILQGIASVAHYEFELYSDQGLIDPNYWQEIAGNFNPACEIPSDWKIASPTE